MTGPRESQALVEPWKGGTRSPSACWDLTQPSQLAFLLGKRHMLMSLLPPLCHRFGWHIKGAIEDTETPGQVPVQTLTLSPSCSHCGLDHLLYAGETRWGC